MSCGSDVSLPDNVLAGYGEVAVAEPVPIVQVLAQYDVPGRIQEFNVLSGSVDLGNGEFECSTGVEAQAIGGVRSERRAAYRSGQGLRARFTARFPDVGVIDSGITAGLNNPSDSLSFGYLDDQGFGILHRYGGVLEVRELAITVAASGAEVVDVELDGITYQVSVTAGSVNDNAREISDGLNSQPLATGQAAGLVTTWIVEACDNLVIARSFILFGPRDAPYSVSSTGTLDGTWSRKAAGVEPVIDFHRQVQDWNIDKMPDLIPANLNEYEFKIKHGAGSILCSIEDSVTGRFKAVHRIRWPNTTPQPIFTQPSFRLGWFARSTGSTVNLRVSGTDGSIFNDGAIVATGAAKTHVEQQNVSPHATNFTAILAVRARLTMSNRPNLSTAALISATFGSEVGKASIVKVVKNPTLDINWFCTDPESLLEIGDVSGSPVVSDGRDIEARAIPREQGAELPLAPLNELLNAGDVLALVVNFSSGAAADFLGTLNWTEDF